MRNPMAAAMCEAASYARHVALGDIVRAMQERRTIEELVGYYEDGRFVLPRIVREEMGLDPRTVR